MSFGFSVGDFLAVGRLCWSVYKRCKESPGNYAELASEIGNLHNVIKETEELLAQQSLTSIQQQRLAACHRGCRAVLTDFDALLAKYESLGTQSRRTFDRMGFGMHDMNAIRLRLISNTSILDAFNNASSHARLERKLSMLVAEIRAGKREGSIVSVATVDTITHKNNAAWEDLRKELEDIGISPSVLIEKKEHIIAWFQEAAATGQLEERVTSVAGSGPNSLYEVSDSGDDGVEALRLAGDAHSRNVNAVGDTAGDRSSTGVTTTSVERDTHIVALSSPPKTRTDLPFHIDQPDSGSPFNGDKRRSRSLVTTFLRVLQGRTDETGWEKANIKDFAKAVNAGDIDAVSNSLRRGVPIDVVFKGRRALDTAVSNGDIEMARCLLENGAQVNSVATTRFTSKKYNYVFKEGMTPLHFASSCGDTEMMKLLLERGADVQARLNVTGFFQGYDTLFYATRYGHADAVKLSLEKGADIETKDIRGRTPLLIAVSKASLSQRQFSKASLSERQSNMDTLRLLLEKGANTKTPDERGFTPLQAAISIGQQDVVKLLLDYKADPNAITGYSGPGNFYPNPSDEPTTLTEWAKSNSSESIYRLLLDASINRTTQEREW